MNEHIQPTEAIGNKKFYFKTKKKVFEWKIYNLLKVDTANQVKWGTDRYEQTNDYWKTFFKRSPQNQISL